MYYLIDDRKIKYKIIFYQMQSSLCQRETQNPGLLVNTKVQTTWEIES